ncbi:MAG: hypothetical protein M3539_18475 [Acidobacteriota bacterium]|nr:hypothetical protein [Acidobacteriota bacterium]
MAQTLTFDSVTAFKVGIVYGYSVARRDSKTASKTVIASPHETGSLKDPFEELFGRYDDDPSWEAFPSWLKRYRNVITEVSLVPSA